MRRKLSNVGDELDSFRELEERLKSIGQDDEIVRRDFEREIYKQCDEEDREENEE